MTTHVIELGLLDYGELVDSNRDFDVQMNTQEFKVGDAIHYHEWDYSVLQPTGRMIARTISMVVERDSCMPLRVRLGLRTGYCVLGISR